jgi:hypothetical protein
MKNQSPFPVGSWKRLTGGKRQLPGELDPRTTARPVLGKGCQE